jgi:integrase
VRRYELALRLHVLPAIGHLRLCDVDRARIRKLIRAMQLKGRDPSSIRNELDPLRVIFREAIEDGEITVDPMVKLVLPHGRGRRTRVADRAECQRLLDALPDDQRCLWATAFYGGLRRGELRSLRWSDIDLDAGVINVSRTMDDKQGEVAAKSEAGERSVPLAGMLRKALVEHKLATGRGGDQLVFGRTSSDPFTSSTVGLRAYAAWAAAGLERISLHEARHSAASYLIEAGLNDLELTTMLGHSDVRTTLSIYGHLFPDSRRKVAAKLDRYLGETG